MKQYIRERQKQEKMARTAGAVLTVAAHVLACVFFVFSGVKYIYPPPPENTFVIDFTEDETERPKQYLRGAQPQAEEIDRTKPIELVQKSESPYKATSKTSETPATRPDDFGDVETSAVEQKDALDPRAAFPGMSKKDTSLTAPHSAAEASDRFKAGQPSGNTDNGRTEGTPNAHVKGRNVVGNLPRPTYSAQTEGTVVVKIWVDNYGKVTKAQAGADGTTVTDKTLWNAARNAAMSAHFNTAADAPALQEGTITYIFKLK